LIIVKTSYYNGWSNAPIQYYIIEVLTRMIV